MKIRMTDVTDGRETVEWEGDLADFIRVNGGDDVEVNLDGRDAATFERELRTVGVVELPRTIGSIARITVIEG